MKTYPNSRFMCCTPQFYLKIAQSWFTRGWCVTLGSFFFVMVYGVMINSVTINRLENLKCVSGNITWDEI